jgi:hypothetical protein
VEQWEHCRLFTTKGGDVYVQFFRGAGDTERVGYTGPGRPEGADALPLQIGALGLEGWELVSVLRDDDPSILETMTFFFKRRLP